MLRGTVVGAGGVHPDGWVLVDGDRVQAAGTGVAPPVLVTIDVGAETVAPGYVDVHVHGGGGHQVAGDTGEEVAAAIRRVARHHVRHGTTSLVATTVSDTPDRLLAAAAGTAMAMRSPRPGEPTILGLHLEGPWLAPARAGAHDRTRLRPPDPAELDALVDASEGAIRIVTLAPELPGAPELIRAGRAAGITMSVGHTDADFDTVAAAFGAGAAHVTHLGNAMAPIDRRHPGPVAAALADRSATLEVIADGIHVHPGFLAMLGVVAPDRLVAVTDATSACGMPPGVYRLGASAVVVDGDRVVLADDPATLAGSVLTMDRAVATLVRSGLDLAGAVRAATRTPAAVASAVRKGHLGAGADADIVVSGLDGRAVATIVGGRVAWDPGARLAAVGRPLVETGSQGFV